MSLKKQTYKGLKWTTASSLVFAAVQLLQVVVLTRFLEKEDFGLMAIILVVNGFVNIFLDMGISNAIIHKQSVSQNQLSSLYWVNVISGFVFFAIVALLSPLIAYFYKQPRLTELIIVSASAFIVSSFSRQFRILLQKELYFKTISIAEIIASVGSFIVTVVLAYLYRNVYSLVIGTLLNSIVQSIIIMISGLRICKPALRCKKSDIKEFLSFGRFQMGEKIINYFFNQLDTILIGRLISVEALGLYTLAKNLVAAPVSIINQIVSRVSFPVMSKLQDNDIALKNIYLKTLHYLAIINFPIYFVLFILAQPIIIFLYGESWIEATAILQILSITWLIRSTGNPVGSLLLAKGRADMGFYWVLSLIGVIPVFIYVGSFWGILGVCFGLLANQLILYYPGYKFLISKLIPVGFFEYLLSMWKPFVFTIVSSALSFFWVFIVTDNVLKITFVVTTGGIVYFLLNYFFNRRIRSEFNEFRNIK